MRYKIISSWLVLGQGLRVRIAAWLEYKEPDREVLGRGLWIGLYMKGLLADELFTILEIGYRVSNLGSIPGQGLPRWLRDKGSTCQYKRCKRCGFNAWVGKTPWSRKWQSTPVFLPGKFHGQRSLVGYSPWGHKEPDMTDHAEHRVSKAPNVKTLETQKIKKHD